jgi:hypothetical protein
MPMKRLLTRSYIALLAMAAFSAALAVLAGGHTLAVALILALAFAKSRLVLFDFMGLRGHGQGMAAACLAWCGLLLALAFARFLLVP